MAALYYSMDTYGPLMSDKFRKLVHQSGASPEALTFSKKQLTLTGFSDREAEDFVEERVRDFEIGQAHRSCVARGDLDVDMETLKLLAKPL